MSFNNHIKQSIIFPDPENANDEGLLAVGGDLSPNMLISAYSQGIFPWFNEDSPILWWSPDPRLILYPHKFKMSSSLKQQIKNKNYIVRFDTNFPAIIRKCASIPRTGQDGTWITPEMVSAYIQLHELGFAHSVEVYNKENNIVGGLYGVSLGKAFFGESMFFVERDASKIALYYLVQKLLAHDFHFIDAQQSTNHLKSLGAEEVSRKKFLEMLKTSLKHGSLVGNWESI